MNCHAHQIFRGAVLCDPIIRLASIVRPYPTTITHSFSPSRNFKIRGSEIGPNLVSSSRSGSRSARYTSSLPMPIRSYICTADRMRYRLMMPPVKDNNEHGG